LRGPDLLGVVLHPSGLRIDLAELLLRHRHDVALKVEHDAARARGALVQRQQILHVTSPLSSIGSPVATTHRPPASSRQACMCGSSDASVNSTSTWDRWASWTMARRENLEWSATSHTSRDCSMIACAAFTSR